ncbi:MAG: alpha amylase C-terminal domain-containing protein [Verrucomicrobia bacterium]|nr:alpha amylase C-terminal domain-containing protein [Verrucomicrobiota bacterium]
MQRKVSIDVARLVLVVTVFASVTAAHAQDRTAEYKAHIASIEHFNELQREAEMPEIEIPSYEEWLTAEQSTGLVAGTSSAAAAPVAAISSGQGGSPPPSAPLTGGLTALQLYQIWATHCGNSTNAATTDDDGDGVSNQDEVLAGTDPDDENDFFSIVDFELQDTNALIAYTTETLRDYELQTATALVLPSWTVTGTTTGTGEIVTNSITLESFRHCRANIAGALDSDDEGVPDWLERCVGTDPLKADTDGDGTTDDQELLNGTPANNAVHVNGHNGNFRLWAPHASSVSVRGTFNGWAETAMTSEGTNGYWSVKVAQTVTNSAEYKFYIDGTTWIADPTSRKLDSGGSDSVYVNPYAYEWTDVDFVPPAKNETIIYQLHIGGLSVSNSTPGTFAQAETKLPYIADLGFTAVELLPVNDYQGTWSWGYNLEHPYRIEEQYGDVDALKSFVDTAHSLGLAVYFDFVINHWHDGSSTPGTFNQTPGGVWDWDGTGVTGDPGGLYYYGDTDAELHWTQWGPRPDYSTNGVRNFLVQNAQMWIRDYHGDGLRWDATKAIRNKDSNLDLRQTNKNLSVGWTMMQDINENLHALYPELLSMAEDLADPSETILTNDMTAMTEEISNTTHNALGGAGFDSQWDNLHEIKNAVVIDADPWIAKVQEDLERVIGDDPFHRVNYITSHDEINELNEKLRIATQIASNNSISTTSTETQLRCILGNAMVLTAPGIPLLFMGDEFADDGVPGTGSGGWTESRALEWSKTNTMSKVVNDTSALIALRKNTSGTTQGLMGEHIDVYHVNDAYGDVLAFHRYDAGGTNDDVVVLANFSGNSWTSYDIGMPSGGTWTIRFVSNPPSGGNPGDLNDTVTPVQQSKDGLPYTGTFKLGDYSVLIVSKNE